MVLPVLISYRSRWLLSCVSQMASRASRAVTTSTNAPAARAWALFSMLETFLNGCRGFAQQHHRALTPFPEEKCLNKRMRKRHHVPGHIVDDDLLLGQHGNPGTEFEQGVKVVRHHHDRERHVLVPVSYTHLRAHE